MAVRVTILDSKLVVLRAYSACEAQIEVAMVSAGVVPALSSYVEMFPTSAADETFSLVMVWRIIIPCDPQLSLARLEQLNRVLLQTFIEIGVWVTGTTLFTEVVIAFSVVTAVVATVKRKL